MYRSILSVTLICCLCATPRAQRLSFQAGFSWMASWETPYRYTAVYTDRPSHEVITSKDYLPFIGVHAHPSLRIWQAKARLLSVGVGVPLSLSALFSTNTATGASPNNYSFLSLPLQLEFNFGTAAKAGKGKFGGFIGIGAGLQSLRARTFTYYDQPLRYSQFNSYFSAGIRFPVHEFPVQIAVARAYPFQQREHLGELPSIVQVETWLPRSYLRGTDVISISVFMGKKQKIKPANPVE